MSDKTQYLAHALLNHTLRNTAYTSPTTVYLGLHTSVAEVSGGSYARQAITFGAPSNGEVKNSADVKFPVATGDWGEIVNGKIYDAEELGNALYEADLTVSKTIDTNDQFVVRENDCTVKEE